MTNTRIIVITQKHVGSALVKAAKNIFGKLPIDVITVSVNYRVDPENLLLKLKKIINKFDADTPLLVLTDLFGSTSSNIANRLPKICDQPIKVIAGLNLPMLVKTLNYPTGSLAELAKNAIFGGKQGVLDCEYCT